MKEQVRENLQNAMKFRIDRLSPSVKTYLAIGEALKNPTLSLKEQYTFKDMQLNTLKNFNNDQKIELVDFIGYRRKVEKIERE